MAQTVTASAAQHPAPSTKIHLIARELPREGYEAACCGARSADLPLRGHGFTPDRDQVTCAEWVPGQDIAWHCAVSYVPGSVR